MLALIPDPNAMAAIEAPDCSHCRSHPLELQAVVGLAHERIAHGQMIGRQSGDAPPRGTRAHPAVGCIPCGVVIGATAHSRAGRPGHVTAGTSAF